MDTDKAFKMLLRHMKVSVTLLIVCVCTLEFNSATSGQPIQTSTVSFYGATHIHGTSPSSSLHVSLQFILSRGTLLSASTHLNSTLTLSLANGNLSVQLLSSHKAPETLLALPISQSAVSPVWVAAELSVSERLLSLALSGTTRGSELSQALNFTGEVFIGGVPWNNSSAMSYVGCLSNLTINSQTVQFPADSQGGYNSGCCVPPRRLPSSGTYDPSLWNGVSVVDHRALVDEGATVVITNSNLHLAFPSNLIGYNVGYWLLSDLERYLVFEIVRPPTRGYLTKGGLPISTSGRFYYTDLLSNNNQTEVVYHHGSQEGNVDDVELRAYFICEDGGEGPWSGTITLSISIIETDERPHIAHQSTLILAIGTRRVITSQIISVVDTEASPSKILYTVEYVGGGNCSACSGQPRGQIEKTNAPGQRIKFFSQEEINNGEVAFQHFPQYSDEEVYIGFRVDGGSSAIYPRLLVTPQSGTIHFTPSAPTCYFMEVGHDTILSSTYLNTTTNFEDQEPTVYYDLLTRPRYGRLEVFEPLLDQWFSVDRDIYEPTLPAIGYFTQEAINRGHVRYIHTRANQTGLDTINFQLRSGRFVQPRQHDHSFCFHLVGEDELTETEFMIQSSEVQLREGGSVSIGQFLEISLEEKDHLYSSIGGSEVRAWQLQPVLILTVPPRVGWISLKGQRLTAGDNFTLEDLESSAVLYTHPGNESHTDSFGVYVRSTVDIPLIRQPPPSDLVTIAVAIAPVNSHTPEYSSESGIFVTEGSFVTVTSKNILLVDRDLPGDELYIHIRKRIRQNRPQEYPTGFFARASSRLTPIYTFTMEDVFNEQIIFKHLLNESARLTYFQTLRLTDGDFVVTPKPLLPVTAVPHNLTAELTEPSLDMDLLDSRLLLIDHTHFAFSMTDRHGEDTNLLPMVGVLVGEFPRHGQLVMVVDGNESLVTEFTISDLQMDRIWYRFTSSESTRMYEDTLALNFQYGHSFAGPVQIHISISPEPAIDTVVRVNSLEVSNEGLTSLSPAHLWANNTRGEGGTAIIYEVTARPLYGDIINEHELSGPLSNFTQADIDNMHIAYNRHEGAGHLSDSVELRVCTVSGVCTDPMILLLEVFYIDLQVVNRGFNVTEGKNYTLTLNDLNATKPSGFSMIRFVMKTPPVHGNVTHQIGASTGLAVHFNQEDIRNKWIVYHSNIDKEELEDMFLVEITTIGPDGRVLSVITRVLVTIIPFNDHLPLVSIGADLEVAKEGSIQIVSSYLSASDSDSDINDLNLIYTTLLHFPRQGYLYLDRDPGDSSLGIQNWTERDIQSGRLYYRTTVSKNGGNVIDVIVFRVDESPELLGIPDRRGNTQLLRFQITDIVFVEHENVSDFVVVEGGSKLITSEFLGYHAQNDHNVLDEHIVYKITNLTRNGALYLNGQALQIGARFIQQDVVNGSLSYAHDHSNTDEDSFTFQLGDTSNRTSARVFTFHITVEILDDDPPVVTIRNPVLVVDFSRTVIDQRVIEITDEDTVRSTSISSDLVKCVVVKQPSLGVLQFKRTGSNNWVEIFASGTFSKYDIDGQLFRYENLVQGSKDSFSFTVTDGTNPRNTTYEVDVIILPEVVTLTLFPLTVDEDSYSLLESSHFVVQHEYLRNLSGTYSVRSPPRKGYLENLITREANITSFTTQQLKDEQIVYRHGGSEGLQDSMTIQYRSDHPQGLSRESDPLRYMIDIIPNNDQPPVLYHGRSRLLNLWAREIKVLDQHYFNASDGDTFSSLLRYTVFTPLSNDGYIAYRNDTARRIITFTQTEVNEGAIVYVHRTVQDSILQYNVTDGDFVTSGSLSIQADPLDLECAIRTVGVDCPWNSISVDQGSEVTLSVNNLCCVTIDDERSHEREIRYHIEFIQYGGFYVRGESRTFFTKRDLTEGVVSFRHTDMDYWERVATARFRVETDYDTHITEETNIAINLPTPLASGLPAINTGLTVTEGAVACLNLSTLDARNVRYQAFRAGKGTNQTLVSIDVLFMLTQHPVSGRLSIGGRPLTSNRFKHSDLVRGDVCYHHGGSETHIDSFRFRLSVTIGGVKTDFDEATFNIEIIPVNDRRPVLPTVNPSVELVRGYRRPLTQADLSVTDPDTGPEGVFFHLISLPSNTHLYLGESQLLRGDRFSQWHIDNGRVWMRATATPPTHDHSFVFNVTDEGEGGVAQRLELFVSVVEHTLDVIGTREVAFRQDQRVALITTHSLSSISNAQGRGTNFTITRSPTKGFVMINDSVTDSLREISLFTQADIDQGRVLYIPYVYKNSERHNDSFAITVSNGDLIKSTEVSVRVLVSGQIRRDTLIDFSQTNADIFGEQFSHQLPTDIIELGQNPGIPPVMEVLDPPKYGYLQLRVTPSNKRLSSSSITTQFHYDDLKRGWIFYVWDPPEEVTGPEVTDNFTLLVRESSSRPGEAFVELRIRPPPIATPPDSTSWATPPSTVSLSPGDPQQDEVSGFPVYTLIPIVGVIVLLLCVILVIVLVCVFQQKHKKFRPSVNLHSVNSPAPVSPSLSPTHHMGFTFDPSIQEPDSEDNVSGFSEDEELPPPHGSTFSRTHSVSPTFHQSGPSPAYTVHRPHPQHRPRVPSNVSITLSGRHSSFSQVSIGEQARPHSHSLPRPPPLDIIVPVPIRPASQSAHRMVNGESGYNSCVPTNENSRQQSLTTVDYQEEGELSCGDFPSALDDNCGVLKPGVEPDTGRETPVFLNLNDPQVQQKFRSTTHPVLKKQDYWY